MPTVKQKRVAKLIIENVKLDKPMTGGEIVESSGYGVSMKKNPQVVLESDGVKEVLNDYGFNEDNAKRVVSEIMLNKKEKSDVRLKATDQVFKVHKSYGSDGNGNKTLIINIIPETAQRYAISSSTKDNSIGPAQV